MILSTMLTTLLKIFHDRKIFQARMQIWRTTRSSPGTSDLKARLVSLRCFVLKILPQKTLALSSICSVLFRCAYELLYSECEEKG